MITYIFFAHFFPSRCDYIHLLFSAYSYRIILFHSLSLSVFLSCSCRSWSLSCFFFSRECSTIDRLIGHDFSLNQQQQPLKHSKKHKRVRAKTKMQFKAVVSWRAYKYGAPMLVKLLRFIFYELFSFFFYVSWSICMESRRYGQRIL